MNVVVIYCEHIYNRKWGRRQGVEVQHSTFHSCSHGLIQFVESTSRVIPQSTRLLSSVQWGCKATKSQDVYHFVPLHWRLLLHPKLSIKNIISSMSTLQSRSSAVCCSDRALLSVITPRINAYDASVRASVRHPHSC